MKQHTFKVSLLSLCVAGVLGMVPHAFAADAQPSVLPKAQPFPGQGKAMLLSQKDLMEYKALPSYSEPEWVNKLVKEGKLPPVYTAVCSVWLAVVAQKVGTITPVKTPVGVALNILWLNV